jgi:hypothetical protein
MYGPAIMVSPVTTLGQTSRSVYFPAGKWYDFWTGESVTGGAKTNVNAPLSQIPLHIRAGSILPMGPEIQYATQNDDTIELRVYPGANGSFTLYEDEGDNYNYETGKYAMIPITYNDDAKTVSFGARSGSAFTGMDQKKVFNIIFVAGNHGVGEAITTPPDKQVIYTGESSITRTWAAVVAMQPADLVMRTIGKAIAFPEEFSGKTKDVAVYNGSGRLLRKAVVKKNAVDVRKDFGLPTGVYFVKALVIR